MRSGLSGGAGAFFTLGLMSTLEQLLQVPLATVVAPLRLCEEAKQALLQGARAVGGAARAWAGASGVDGGG